jgi:hypothetical protein
MDRVRSIERLPRASGPIGARVAGPVDAALPTRKTAGSLPKGQGEAFHEDTLAERRRSAGEQSEAATQSRVLPPRTARQSSRSLALR